MRIAISAVVGMTVTLSGAAALAQAPPAPPPAASPGTPSSAAGSASSAPAVPSTPGVPASPVLAAAAAPATVASVVAVPEPNDDLRVDTAGWSDGFYLRDAHDLFRFYPHVLVEADFYSSFGPGTTGVTAPDVAAGLKPRLLLRRARLGFDAELLRRWSLTALFELGNQPLGNTAGTAETSAAAPATTPSAASGRYAPVQSVAAAPYAADVFIGYGVCRCFNLQLGQFNVPFSLDNRTADEDHALLERPVAIRGFVVPSERDLGGIIWGELGPRVFSYELGVFGGDGQNRPSVDARVDFIGRFFLRPFAGTGTTDLAKYAQIGVSARHGDRDATAVAYDAPAITTGQGFVLWKPTYTDSMGRLVHVIPSGAQNEIGGELRLRSGRFALQGEAYYVANDTREAIDGYQLTNTERFGQMLGVGWYVQASAWPFGDAFLTPEPGIFRPRHLDIGRPYSRHVPQGLEMIAVLSGINGSYRGASRLGSTLDQDTPSGDITVYQIGVAANYWHTSHARFGVSYMAYVTPGSGTADNQAVVPGNLPQQGAAAASAAAGSGHVLHELSARLALTF